MDILKISVGVAIGMLCMYMHNASVERAVKAERRRHADDMNFLRDEMRADRRQIKEAAYSAGYAAGKQISRGDNNG